MNPVLLGGPVLLAAALVLAGCGGSGAAGSGKSTLLRTIYRAIRPIGRAVLVGDREVWELSAREAARRTAARSSRRARASST